MRYRLATLRDSDALASVAHACAPELPDNLTMQLGLRFLKAYYKAVLAEPSTVAACVESSDPARVVGFALATIDSAAMIAAIRRVRWRLGLAALTGIARRPWLLADLLTRVNALRGTESIAQYVIAEGPKVSFLAVEPKARTTQTGPRLMKNVVSALRASGCGAVQAEVDETNPRVIRLHERLGATQVRSFTTAAGIVRVILEYPAAPAAVA